MTTYAVNGDVDGGVVIKEIDRVSSKDNESEVRRCREIGGC